ncbi:MAG: SpoIIE family protein phosphatase [Bacillota bacterium]
MDQITTNKKNNIKILIVEDNQGLNNLITKKLDAYDYQYQQAYSGEKALELISNQEFDLLLLDYRLPDMTAKSLIADLEKVPAFIVMTGNGNEEVAVEMMKLGAVDYLVKDYNFIELLPEVINHVLKELENQQKLKEAYQQLKEKEKRYQLLFENTGTATAIIKKDGEISLVNEEFESLTAYSKAEIESQMKCTDLIAAEKDLEDIITSDSLGRLKEMPEKYEFKIKDKAGEIKDVLIKIKIIPETKERIVSMLDISGRKEREKELDQAYQQLNQNIEKARSLHQHFLPESDAKFKHFSIATYYHPADELGGDFYNYQEVNGQLVFYVADVTGHGLDGAMLNLLVRDQINNFITEAKYCSENNEIINKDLVPQEMMQAVFDNYLKQNFPEDYFLCMQIGVLDFEEQQLEYTNAGFHILPFVISKTGELDIIENSHLPIADLEAARNQFSSQKYQLNAGDKLFITTDGLIEESYSGQRYGQQRLRTVLQENYYLPADILLEKIERDLKKYTGEANSNDDITFLMLEKDLKKKMSQEINSEFDEMYQLEEKIVQFLDTYVQDTDFLQIGIHEIITNAIEHGNDFDNEKKIKVEVAICEQYIRVLVADQGAGFNWQNRVDVEPGEVSFAERGRGLMMVSQVYDQIEFNQHGNQVCLIKFRT